MATLKVKDAYTGKLTVRQYSDSELRNAILETNDPSSVGPMAGKPPLSDQDMEFVAQYRADEVVICSFGHHHKKGFVLKDNEGLHYLIGKDCAADHYGLNWDAFAKDVSRNVNRQSDLRWLDDIARRTIGARQEIERVIGSPAVAAFDQLRLDVQKLPPSILAAFYGASGVRDTWMRATFRQRDYKAERLARERAYEAYEESVKWRWPTAEQKLLKKAMVSAQQQQIWSETVRSVLRCPAPTVFRSGHKMQLRLQSIANNLNSQAVTLLESIRVSQPQFAAKSMSQAAKEFDAVLAEINAAAMMFSPSVLDLLMQCFQGDEFKYVQARRLSYGIAFTWDYGKEVTLRLPNSLQPISFSLHERLHIDDRV